MNRYRMQRFVNGVVAETKELGINKTEALKTAKAFVNSLGGRKAQLSTVQVQRKAQGMAQEWTPIATYVQSSTGRAVRT